VAPINIGGGSGGRRACLRLCVSRIANSVQLQLPFLAKSGQTRIRTQREGRSRRPDRRRFTKRCQRAWKTAGTPVVAGTTPAVAVSAGSASLEIPSILDHEVVLLS
jgi:hypothetical protein